MLSQTDQGERSRVLGSRWTPFRATLLLIVLAFAAALVYSKFFTKPLQWDEFFFWRTSLFITDLSIPIGDRVEQYEELNTPLVFIIFGLVGRAAGGYEAARALSMASGIGIALAIGWSGREGTWNGFRSLIGFLINPYVLLLSTLAYTDMITAAFLVLGVLLQRRSNHLLAALAFTAAIACRQFAVVVPLAIVADQFLATKGTWRFRRPSLTTWIWSLLAASTLVGWLVLFDGLATEDAIEERLTPPVQQSFFALTPGSGMFGLAAITVYFVFVEIVVRPGRSILIELSRWSRRHSAIVVGVLGLTLVFPPAPEATGQITQILSFGPIEPLRTLIIGGLAALAAVRFSRGGFEMWVVLGHTAVMMKAYQWDRYAVPILAVLWLLSSWDNESSPASKPFRRSTLTNRNDDRALTGQN